MDKTMPVEKNSQVDDTACVMPNYKELYEAEQKANKDARKKIEGLYDEIEYLRAVRDTIEAILGRRIGGYRP